MKLQEQINRINKMMGVLNEDGRAHAFFKFLDKKLNEKFGKILVKKTDISQTLFSYKNQSEPKIVGKVLESSVIRGRQILTLHGSEFFNDIYEIAQKVYGYDYLPDLDQLFLDYFKVRYGIEANKVGIFYDSEIDNMTENMKTKKYVISESQRKNILYQVLDKRLRDDFGELKLKKIKKKHNSAYKYELLTNKEDFVGAWGDKSIANITSFGTIWFSGYGLYKGLINLAMAFGYGQFETSTDVSDETKAKKRLAKYFQDRLGIKIRGVDLKLDNQDFEDVNNPQYYYPDDDEGEDDFPYDEEQDDNEEEVNEGELTEKCWPGYTQKGMKTMFGKRYPNCVKKTKK